MYVPRVPVFSLPSIPVSVLLCARDHSSNACKERCVSKRLQHGSGARRCCVVGQRWDRCRFCWCVGFWCECCGIIWRSCDELVCQNSNEQHWTESDLENCMTWCRKDWTDEEQESLMEALRAAQFEKVVGNCGS